MNPLPLLLARWRADWPVALLFVLVLGLALALGVGVNLIERGLRQGANRVADPFSLIVGVAGGPTQLVLSTVYLQPTALPLLPGDVLGKLENDPRAAWAAPIGFGDSWRGLPVVGTTTAFLTLGGRRMPAAGRWFDADDEAVVGAKVPLALGDTLTPRHGHPLPTRGHVDDDDDDDPDHASHDGVVYRVVGRLPPAGGPWDHAILVPITAVWSIHGLSDGREGRPRPGVPAVVVQPRSIADAYTLRTEWRRGGTTAVFPAEVLIELYRVLGGLQTILQATGAGTGLLVGAVVVMALALAAVARRRTFAALRAIGAGRAFILALIWCEAAALLLAAGATGLGLGVAGALIAARAIEARTGVLPSVTLAPADLAGLAVVVIIGLLVVAVPAMLVARRPIGPALKHVD